MKWNWRHYVNCMMCVKKQFKSWSTMKINIGDHCCFWLATTLVSAVIPLDELLILSCWIIVNWHWRSPLLFTCHYPCVCHNTARWTAHTELLDDRKLVSPEARCQTVSGFTKFTQLHVVTSLTVMCALRARRAPWNLVPCPAGNNLRKIRLVT